MDRLRRLIAAHPDLFSRQPLLKRMLTGLDDEQANGVADILEILIRHRGETPAASPIVH